MRPKQFIFPTILFSTTLLFVISRSIYSFSLVNDLSSTSINNPFANQPIQHSEISDGYPQSIQQWSEEITSVAQEHDLDPNFIAAVMLQESGGQANIISTSGAVGLMQIMPRDGIAASFSCINGPCFQNRPSTKELNNPIFNIEFGTRMLAGLINSRGSLRLALRAYGPMDVGFYYADQVFSIYDTRQ